MVLRTLELGNNGNFGRLDSNEICTYNHLMPSAKPAAAKRKKQAMAIHARPLAIIFSAFPRAI